MVQNMIHSYDHINEKIRLNRLQCPSSSLLLRLRPSGGGGGLPAAAADAMARVSPLLHVAAAAVVSLSWKNFSWVKLIHLSYFGMIIIQ